MDKDTFMEINNMEKFEIMQSIQNIIDNSNENKTIDKLIRLRNQLHNTSKIESKFSATAYMITNLRTMKLITDEVSGLSSLRHREEI